MRVEFCNYNFLTQGPQNHFLPLMSDPPKVQRHPRLLKFYSVLKKTDLPKTSQEKACVVVLGSRFAVSHFPLF